MPRTEGLDLLADLEKMQQNNVEVRDDELNWWANRFPQVPSSVWKFMKGQGDSWRDHASQPTLEPSSTTKAMALSWGHPALVLWPELEAVG